MRVGGESVEEGGRDENSRVVERPYEDWTSPGDGDGEGTETDGRLPGTQWH